MFISRVACAMRLFMLFLNESGLKDNFEHVNRMGHEETMVDWIAVQFPKIAAVYKELGIL